jgi:hypothetical protein
MIQNHMAIKWPHYVITVWSHECPFSTLKTLMDELRGGVVDFDSISCLYSFALATLTRL